MVKNVCPNLQSTTFQSMVGAIERHALKSSDGKLRLAVFFDADDTLANHTASDFISFLGEDPLEFWAIMSERWSSGWAGSECFLYGLREISEQRTIRRQDFIDFGGKVSLFSGVHDLFDRLRTFAYEICPAIELSFYLVSSGIADIFRHMPIAHEFNGIFACEWHYGERDEILFPRRTMNPENKCTAVNVVARGLSSTEYMENQFRAGRRSLGFAIPYSQMIMVGDSEGDAPAMSLLLAEGGRAIAVHHPEREPDEVFSREIVELQRALGPFPADFSPGLELEKALQHALFSCAIPMFLRSVVG